MLKFKVGSRVIITKLKLKGEVIAIGSTESRHSRADLRNAKSYEGLWDWMGAEYTVAVIDPLGLHKVSGNLAHKFCKESDLTPDGPLAEALY